MKCLFSVDIEDTLVRVEYRTMFLEPLKNDNCKIIGTLRFYMNLGFCPKARP